MADKKKTVQKKAAAPKPASRKPAAKPARTAKAAPESGEKKLRIQDLAKIRERTQAMLTVREGKGRAKVTVHMGTCGIAAGAREVMDALLDEMQKRNVRDVIVTTSGCVGLCSREPMATVELKDKPPVKYIDLNAQKIRKILVEHVLGGTPVAAYALAIGSEMIY